ncbi:hypothetical protein BD410DRAFT_349279 [Rickenella mellea]|uniref:Uncharacterized protein n=1 Tax=Rickenella mellea TaxID=50990 RepID=A0A4Y7QKJ8_9AGAM|nr:hypothetical protein BD410DRAFT_349279 [Rickenella mellea]
MIDLVVIHLFKNASLLWKHSPKLTFRGEFMTTQVSSSRGALSLSGVGFKQSFRYFDNTANHS